MSTLEKPIRLTPPKRDTASLNGAGEPSTNTISMVPTAPRFDSSALIIAARSHEDAQKTRKGFELREKAMRRQECEPPEWLRAARIAVGKVEESIHDNVLAAFSRHPLAPWAAQFETRSLTFNLAILVALLDGDPYIAYPRWYEDGQWYAGEPYVRTLAQLRAYCGLGEPFRRRKGMTKEELQAGGKPLLKSRLFLISSFLNMAGEEPWRDIYLTRKHDTEGRQHETSCRGRGRCGLEPGTPWRPGHRHADALRFVSKKFLDGLYGESQRLHEAGEWQ